jgi:hypothetical protein
MWLALLLSAAVCPAGQTPVEVRALDTAVRSLSQAEIRQSSGQVPAQAVMAPTDSQQPATVCVSEGAHVRRKTSPPVSVVDPARPACVTGSAPDGSFRFCTDALRSLPLAF